MSDFTLYDETNAPEGARKTLEATKKAYGFIPNLLAAMAEAPAGKGGDGDIRAGIPGHQGEVIGKGQLGGVELLEMKGAVEHLLGPEVEKGDLAAFDRDLAGGQGPGAVVSPSRRW